MFGFNIDTFTDKEWNSPEYRRYIAACLKEGDRTEKDFGELQRLYEEQSKYVTLLERQMTILQKTLEVAEKVILPIRIPADGEVISNA